MRVKSWAVHIKECECPAGAVNRLFHLEIADSGKFIATRRAWLRVRCKTCGRPWRVKDSGINRVLHEMEANG